MACEHRGCDCKDGHVRDGGKQFCSDFCKSAQMTGHHEDRCKCGHSECKATKQ